MLLEYKDQFGVQESQIEVRRIKSWFGTRLEFNLFTVQVTVYS